jgi:hypothetical protein
MIWLRIWSPESLTMVLRYIGKVKRLLQIFSKHAAFLKLKPSRMPQLYIAFVKWYRKIIPTQKWFGNIMSKEFEKEKLS